MFQGYKKMAKMTGKFGLLKLVGDGSPVWFLALLVPIDELDVELLFFDLVQHDAVEPGWEDQPVAIATRRTGTAARCTGRLRLSICRCRHHARRSRAVEFRHAAGP